MRAKWQVVENVVAAIESAAHSRLPDLEVTPKAKLATRGHPGALREVDVLVSFSAGGRQIRIGIDVKAHSRPLDIEMVGSLYEKASSLSIDRFVVVSTSGFTTTAFDVYTNKGLDLLRLEEVESLSWAGFNEFIAYRREFVFRACKLNYHDGNLPQLEELHTSTMMVEGFLDGTSSDLGNYLARLIGEAHPPVFTNDGPIVGDGPEMRVEVECTPEVRQQLKLMTPHGALPLPISFTVLGRFRTHRETSPVLKFRDQRGSEVVAALMPDPQGHAEMQLSLVSNPTADDGVRLSLQPLTPRPTRVD